MTGLRGVERRLAALEARRGRELCDTSRDINVRSAGMMAQTRATERVIISMRDEFDAEPPWVAPPPTTPFDGDESVTGGRAIGFLGPRDILAWCAFCRHGEALESMLRDSFGLRVAPAARCLSRARRLRWVLCALGPGSFGTASRTSARCALGPRTACGKTSIGNSQCCDACCSAIARPCLS